MYQCIYGRVLASAWMTPLHKHYHELCLIVLPDGVIVCVYTLYPDPPGIVTFDRKLDCDSVEIGWTSLPNVPCPIIGYFVSVTGTPVFQDPNWTNYTYPVRDSDCGNSFDISVYAVSAAGTGSVSTKSLLITCTREEANTLLMFILM